MKSVLMVDDDNPTLLGLGVRLKAMSYSVFTAKNAASAVAAVRKSGSDVVVLDVSLPAGDGFVAAVPRPRPSSSLRRVANPVCSNEP
jgi:DNA-binding NtrC family response regulator